MHKGTQEARGKEWFYTDFRIRGQLEKTNPVKDTRKRYLTRILKKQVKSHCVIFLAEISPAKAKNFKSTQGKWQVLAPGKAENWARTLMEGVSR